MHIRYRFPSRKENFIWFSFIASYRVQFCVAYYLSYVFLFTGICKQCLQRQRHSTCTSKNLY